MERSKVVDVEVAAMTTRVVVLFPPLKATLSRDLSRKSLCDYINNLDSSSSSTRTRTLPLLLSTAERHVRLGPFT
jgi:hypothetical protein